MTKEQLDSMKPLFVSRDEAAFMLGISMPTLARYLNDGRVPYTQLAGRVLIPYQFFQDLISLAKIDASKARKKHVQEKRNAKQYFVSKGVARKDISTSLVATKIKHDQLRKKIREVSNGEGK